MKNPWGLLANVFYRGRTAIIILQLSLLKIRRKQIWDSIDRATQIKMDVEPAHFYREVEKELLHFDGVAFNGDENHINLIVGRKIMKVAIVPGKVINIITEK